MSCFGVFLFLYAVSMPITYALPLYWLEKAYLNHSFEDKAELIVILGGGLTESTSYEKPNVSFTLLERLRFGAFLQRKTSLPILVTGAGSHTKATEAEVMKRVLEEEFHAKVDFIEDRSKSTEENAKFTYEILKENGIKRIFLLSSSWHLKRAELLFNRYAKEIETIAIGDFFYNEKGFRTDRSDFIPTMSTFYYQRRVLLECLAFWILRLKAL